MLAATRVVASPAPTPATETTVPPSAHSATPARGSSSVVLGTTMAQEAPRRAPLTSAATSADPTARVEGTLSAAMTTTASASCRDCPAPVPAPAPALAPWSPPDPAGAPGMAFDPPCFSWRRIHNTASANPTLQRGESKQTTWRQHRHMTTNLAPRCAMPEFTTRQDGRLCASAHRSTAFRCVALVATITLHGTPISWQVVLQLAHLLHMHTTAPQMNTPASVPTARAMPAATDHMSSGHCRLSPIRV